MPRLHEDPSHVAVSSKCIDLATRASLTDDCDEARYAQTSEGMRTAVRLSTAGATCISLLRCST